MDYRLSFLRLFVSFLVCRRYAGDLGQLRSTSIDGNASSMRRPVLSERRACRLVGLSRSMLHYECEAGP
ncbi:hypothetical protein EVG18_37125 [Burkholderia pyrrocinia]|nr:hypothetical protein EVG18_37125 [Burkholderia pyrrocinia]